MDNLSDKAKQQLENFENLDIDDCLECRLVGGGCSLLLSVYVFYVGHRRHLNAKRPILSRLPSLIAAAGLFSIGVGRLVNYNPFESLPVIFTKSDSKDT